MSIHFLVPVAKDGRSEGLTAMARSSSLIHVPSAASTSRLLPIFVDFPVSWIAAWNARDPTRLSERSEVSNLLASGLRTKARGRCHSLVMSTPWKVEPRAGLIFDV